MKNNASNATTKTILGLFAAAAAGAAIGIAFAPERGEVTRKKMKKKVNTAAKDALDYVETTKENSIAKANEAIEIGKATAKDIQTRATKKLNEMTEA